MGKKFIFPKVEINDLNKALEIDLKEQEEKKMRAVFQRRKGTLQTDQPPHIQDDTMFIKCMIRHEFSE